MHADAGASGRHHGRDLFQRQAGHPLEHRRHFRVRRDRVQIHIHIFCAAGYEHGQHVLLVMIFVFPVVFDHTAQSQLFQQLFRACERFAALFGDFCCCDRYALVHMVTGNLETFNAIVRFNGNHLDADTVAAIFDFRLAVEGFALRRLAKCRTQADVAALRADIERIGDDIASGAMTYTGLAERFQLFHLRICQCSRSAMLPLTMNAVRAGSITLWERYLRTAGLESAVNLLTQFADAIERQDGDAAYALLEQGLDRQLAYYQA